MKVRYTELEDSETAIRSVFRIDVPYLPIGVEGMKEVIWNLWCSEEAANRVGSILGVSDVAIGPSEKDKSESDGTAMEIYYYKDKDDSKQLSDLVMFSVAKDSCLPQSSFLQETWSEDVDESNAKSVQCECTMLASACTNYSLDPKPSTSEEHSYTNTVLRGVVIRPRDSKGCGFTAIASLPDALKNAISSTGLVDESGVLTKVCLCFVVCWYIVWRW